MGQENLRRLFCLVILSTVTEDNPKELMRISLIRASACESLACRMGMESLKFDFFLMGMFSAIDAVLGLPMEEAVTHVPLSDDATAALLGEGGPLQVPLKTVLAYQEGNWMSFSSLMAELDLPESEFPALFQSAVTWADETVQI